MSAGKQTVSEKRTGRRTTATIELRVRGAGGAYEGQTIDISKTGALLWISDERFVPATEQDNMVRFSERVAQEFGETMVVEFGEGGVVRESEVVRVTRKSNMGEKAPMLVACRFVESLDDETWEKIGLAPDGPRLKVKSRKKKADPPPDSAPMPEPGSPDFKERRKHPRVDCILYAEVTGDYGTYKAYALNVSCAGVLITVSDPQFEPPAEADQLVLFTKKMGFHFRSGMKIRFLESEVEVVADVVRVSERSEGGELMIVIGGKFRQPLTREQCERLEIEPPAGVASATPAAPKKPAFKQLEKADGGRPKGKHKTRVLQYMLNAVELNASDLHIKVGSPARLRIAGQLIDVNRDIILPDEAHAMAYDLMTPTIAQRFVDDTDVEFAYSIEDVGRFRICAFQQRGYTGLAVRTIPDHIPTFDELKLSPVARQLADKPRGLVLVTGPTGSGKSHTLAAMIHHINQTRSCHILTMEDPIEFIHTDDRAHITQREIGRDCPNFAQALKRALRQDPDVILVGEMRDLETIALALTAAETGHLVFGTLHTTSASNTPDRIIDVFPPNQQGQIRQQLADSLRGIMAQILVPTVKGDQLALVQEVLVATDAARAIIRDGKAPQLHNIMQTSAKQGMVTLENSLNTLLDRGVISYEMAVAKANVPKQIAHSKRKKKPE